MSADAGTEESCRFGPETALAWALGGCLRSESGDHSRQGIATVKMVQPLVLELAPDDILRIVHEVELPLQVGDVVEVKIREVPADSPGLTAEIAWAVPGRPLAADLWACADEHLAGARFHRVDVGYSRDLCHGVQHPPEVCAPKISRHLWLAIDGAPFVTVPSGARATREGVTVVNGSSWVFEDPDRCAGEVGWSSGGVVWPRPEGLAWDAGVADAGGGPGPPRDAGEPDGSGGGAGGPTFVQIACGLLHTCGLRPGGAVSCWGDNDGHQLEVPPGTFLQIDADGFMTCGLLTSGDAVCWGPIGVSLPGPLSAVSAGRTACGLRTDGTVVCADPYLRVPSEALREIRGSSARFCGLRRGDDALVCWDDSRRGPDAPPPGPFLQFDLAPEFGCGIRFDGTMECWGGFDPYCQAPPVPPADRGFAWIGTGHSVTCAVTADGQVRCTGYSDDGQLEVPAGPFVQLSCGGSHVCALRPDGAAECWGNNSDGQASVPER